MNKKNVWRIYFMSWSPPLRFECMNMFFTILNHVRVFPAVIKICFKGLFFPFKRMTCEIILLPNSCIPPAVIYRLVEEHHAIGLRVSWSVRTIRARRAVLGQIIKSVNANFLFQYYKWNSSTLSAHRLPSTFSFEDLESSCLKTEQQFVTYKRCSLLFLSGWFKNR